MLAVSTFTPAASRAALKLYSCSRARPRGINSLTLHRQTYLPVKLNGRRIRDYLLNQFPNGDRRRCSTRFYDPTLSESSPLLSNNEQPLRERLISYGLLLLSREKRTIEDRRPRVSERYEEDLGMTMRGDAERNGRWYEYASMQYRQPLPQAATRRCSCS